MEKQHVIIPGQPVESIIHLPRFIITQELPTRDNRTTRSRNGFSPRTFWNICDGHADTIVVTNVERTNEIIGRFNPLAWDKIINNWIKNK
ncbi:hypothetical protein Glove_195g35 [Diversispora epigaea]|uniref:Uncharacterized protein n=1 Tax=Diversispora epigaea TaxID=1348612 RepID=A0A397IKQ9_9GLOM|nr:hypothetical protein Glove_195g35 [Diversispora epigaea]